MLIRQKASWRLHHQAYLWPRRRRTSFSNSSAPNPFPPPSSSSSSSSTSPSPPLSAVLTRKRKHNSDTIGSDDEELASRFSPPSIVTSASEESPPKRQRRRQRSNGPAATGFASAGDDISIVPSWPSDQNTTGDSGGDDYGTERAEGVDVVTSTILVSSPDEQSRLESSNPSLSVRTRRDTRGGDPLRASIAHTSTCYTSGGGSSNSSSSSKNPLYSTPKGSSNHSSITNFHCSSRNTSSIRTTESTSEQDRVCSINSNPTCSRPREKMGVLCADKHCCGEGCVCGGVFAISPRPATLPSFPEPNHARTSDGSIDEKPHVLVATRKRSLDVALHDQSELGPPPASRRRTQRSPSAGTVNGTVCHVISKNKLGLELSPKNKLGLELSALVGQNGFKHDLNGLGKQAQGYLNGSHVLCCSELRQKAPCGKCAAHHHHHHHPAVTSPPSLSSSSSLVSSSSTPATSSSSSSLSNHSGKGGVSSSEVASSVSNTDVLLPSSNFITTTTTGTVITTTATTTTTTSGSITHQVVSDERNLRRPQPPCSLSPLSSSSSSFPILPQQLLQPTQGLKSGSNFGDDSGGGVINNACSDIQRCGTTSSTSPKCISGTSNTVPSLRQRSNSDNSSGQKSSPPTASLSSLLSSSSLKSSSSSSSAVLTTRTAPSSSSSASLCQPTLSVSEPPSPSQAGQQPQRVQCKWRACCLELDASDLLEHVHQHAEAQIAKKAFACLWEDCKVYDKPSWSGSWLERHIVTHSGHRPFKCILDNCGQRFHSQAALERHVNGHFTANGHNGARAGRSREEVAASRLMLRRRRQLKRRSLQSVKKSDVFDPETMSLVKHELQTLTEKAQLDLSGTALNVTFRGMVIGRRTTKSGLVESLVDFTPSHVMDAEWMPESKVSDLSEISIPLSQLPADSMINLHTSLYRRHRFRKHRRK